MSTATIPAPVLDVLNRSTIEGNTVKLPGEQMDRKLYEQTLDGMRHINGPKMESEHALLRIELNSERDPLHSPLEVLSRGFVVHEFFISSRTRS